MSILRFFFGSWKRVIKTIFWFYAIVMVLSVANGGADAVGYLISVGAVLWLIIWAFDKTMPKPFVQGRKKVTKKVAKKTRRFFF